MGLHGLPVSAPTSLSDFLPLSYCPAAVNLKDSFQFLPRTLRLVAGQAAWNPWQYQRRAPLNPTLRFL